jgi:hypothetical protein
MTMSNEIKKKKKYGKINIAGCNALTKYLPSDICFFYRRWDSQVLIDAKFGYVVM